MANEFFDRLFDGDTNRVSVDDYAHWVDSEQSAAFGTDNLREISVVMVGQDQDITKVVSSWLAGT